MVGVHKVVPLACNQMRWSEGLGLGALALKWVNPKDQPRLPADRASNHIDESNGVEFTLSVAVITVGPVRRSRGQNSHAQEVNGTPFQLRRCSVACQIGRFLWHRLC